MLSRQGPRFDTLNEAMRLSSGHSIEGWRESWSRFSIIFIFYKINWRQARPYQMCER
jgi:hypothetical protein